jgi:cobalamin-dependent methionine synthase I
MATENLEKVENPIEKLEEQIKELTIMVKTMVNNKTYKTQACQRKAAREYYARNKDTLEFKIKSAINNRKRRDRRILILKQQREKEQERKEPQEIPNNMPIFLGY